MPSAVEVVAGSDKQAACDDKYVKGSFIWAKSKKRWHKVKVLAFSPLSYQVQILWSEGFTKEYTEWIHYVDQGEMLSHEAPVTENNQNRQVQEQLEAQIERQDRAQAKRRLQSLTAQSQRSLMSFLTVYEKQSHDQSTANTAMKGNKRKQETPSATDHPGQQKNKQRRKAEAASWLLQPNAAQKQHTTHAMATLLRQLKEQRATSADSPQGQTATKGCLKASGRNRTLRVKAKKASGLLQRVLSGRPARRKECCQSANEAVAFGTHMLKHSEVLKHILQAALRSEQGTVGPANHYIDDDILSMISADHVF